MIFLKLLRSVTEEIEIKGEQIKAKELALIVIDVQNDFCHPNGAFWKRYQKPMEMNFEEIISRIKQVIEKARAKGVDIIFIQTIHSEWTNSSTWKLRRTYNTVYPSCLPGSWGAEFCGLSPQAGDLVIVKNRYSAFVGTNLDLVLRSRDKHYVALVGFMANVCVETTARDAFQLNYVVYVLKDCIGAATEREFESALFNVEQYFGYVLDSATFWSLVE